MTVPSLSVGDRHILHFTVPREKTVPFLYPESPDFAAMPEVFATGFMVGLMEWACIEALRPYLEPGEGSLGTAICVTHAAPTPPGLTVTVTVTVSAIAGRRITWDVMADDGIDVIGTGRHERTRVRWDRFNARIDEKRPR